jgi:hypothetical protein
MSEQIQIQHRRHKHEEATPVTEIPVGGPDDRTFELQSNSDALLNKIARVLVADSIQIAS